MTNEQLKKFYESIHESLIILPKDKKNNYFIIKESSKDSAIKEIHYIFKKKYNVVIIRQKNSHTMQNILKKCHTSSHCDFIVFLNLNNKLNIIYCEIKSSYNKANLEKAVEQIESSMLFVKYFLDCYSYFYNDYVFDYNNVEVRRIYIYPKIGMSNKNKTYKSDNRDIIIHVKSVNIENNQCVKIKDAYNFFVG